MNEQQNQNKEQKQKKKGVKFFERFKKMSKEKKAYLFTASGCAAVLIAVLVLAIVLTGGDKVQNQVEAPQSSNSSSSSVPDQDVGGGDGGNEDEGEGVVAENMILPLATVTLTHDYGFYYNQTLDAYYEHEGMDFSAASGSEVLAVKSGVIESIYKEDLLLGTEIVIDHGDGVKSVYRFVDEAKGLKVGDEVKRGEVIATVAEANGAEYKDGSHLHFEILKDGVNVDPTAYLTLEEK